MDKKNLVRILRDEKVVRNISSCLSMSSKKTGSRISPYGFFTEIDKGGRINLGKIFKYGFFDWGLIDEFEEEIPDIFRRLLEEELEKLGPDLFFARYGDNKETMDYFYREAQSIYTKRVMDNTRDKLIDPKKLTEYVTYLIELFFTNQGDFLEQTKQPKRKGKMISYKKAERDMKKNSFFTMFSVEGSVLNERYFIENVDEPPAFFDFILNSDQLGCLTFLRKGYDNHAFIKCFSYDPNSPYLNFIAFSQNMDIDPSDIPSVANARFFYTLMPPETFALLPKDVRERAKKIRDELCDTVKGILNLENRTLFFGDSIENETY